MGVLETKRVIQPPKRRRMTKRRRMIQLCLRIAGITAAAVALIILIYMVGFAKYTYVNLSEQTEAIVSGYNGHGTLTTKTTAVAGLEDFFDTVEVSVMETDKITNGNLSNGDKVEISYSFNKEMAKSRNLRVRGGNEFVTIKNLPEGEVISYEEVFSGVKLEYEGVAPFVTVSVSNVSSEPPISGIVYSVAGDKEFYDEGDTVRIEAAFDQEAAIESAYALESGPDGYVKDYTVSGVDRYLTDASELPQGLLDELKEYGATLFGSSAGDANEYGLRIFTAAGAMYSTTGGDYTFAWSAPTYISSYFTCINSELLGEPGQQLNDIKVVYDTGISQADGKYVSAEAVVSFKDVIKKADGTITVDKESGEIVSASTNDSDIKKIVRSSDDENYTSTKLEQ